MHNVGGGKSSKRAFVESTKNQFLLTRVGVDVTHGKNAGDGGLEFFRIDHDLLAIDFQAPIRDGS